MENLVSTDWLNTHLSDPNLRILDASWHMPAENRNAYNEFKSEHIPGAQFFDIDEISDPLSNLPHMLPNIEKFISRVRKLGIADGTKVVIYDTKGIFSAPRAWWMFKFFGKENVAVLDGGLPKWKAEGRATTSQIRAPKDRHLTLSRHEEKLKTVAEVAQASKLGTALILDARPAERFRGDAPEPRAGLRSGHIPGSQNLPFSELLNNGQSFKSKDELREIFAQKGVRENTEIITSCGSGVTAAILSLGLELAGYKNHALYDGSWAEWGGMDLLQVETGEAR